MFRSGAEKFAWVSRVVSFGLLIQIHVVFQMSCGNGVTVRLRELHGVIDGAQQVNGLIVVPRKGSRSRNAISGVSGA